MTRDNWRVICQCQKHRSISLIAVQQLRGPVAALLLTSSLVLLGTTFPIEAMNIASLPLRISVNQTTSSPMIGGTDLVSGSGQPVAGATRELTEVAAQAVDTLRLVTERVKDEFLDPANTPEHLIGEGIKEEFFRTEVPFGSIIYREAKRQGLAPELVAAIVETESDFRPTLQSHKNALGLMQLIPSTGSLMGATDLFNPNENVRAGVKYLRYLQSQFDDPEHVLAAYNAGESVVRKYGGVPPYLETQNFVKRVARNRLRYQQRVAQRMAVAQTLRTSLAQ